MANDIHKPPMILHTHGLWISLAVILIYINWGGWIYLAATSPNLYF